MSCSVSIPRRRVTPHVAFSLRCGRRVAPHLSRWFDFEPSRDPVCCGRLAFPAVEWHPTSCKDSTSGQRVSRSRGFPRVCLQPSNTTWCFPPGRVTRLRLASSPARKSTSEIPTCRLTCVLDRTQKVDRQCHSRVEFQATVRQVRSSVPWFSRGHTVWCVTFRVGRIGKPQVAERALRRCGIRGTWNPIETELSQCASHWSRAGPEANIHQL